MNIVMTIFAFIGFICVGLVGISIATVVWYEIHEKVERRKNDDGKIDQI